MFEEIRKDDRRLFDRFSARYPAKFKDERESFGENVQLCDASAFGAQFSSRDRLFLNDKIALEVELPDGLAPMDLRGEVVWIRKNAANSWNIGLKFYQVELLRMARLYKFQSQTLSSS
ncbi:MAG: PilZ domain-containing protein [Candidatus Omnitrophica bacterium]|nr:PilZ domain-containing protein [Candidatus Omnitrophota bacterium]